jgi:hypothetical protein
MRWRQSEKNIERKKLMNLTIVKENFINCYRIQLIYIGPYLRGDL